VRARYFELGGGHFVLAGVVGSLVHGDEVDGLLRGGDLLGEGSAQGTEERQPQSVHHNHSK